MPKYRVMFEIELGEWMYASVDKAKAEEYAKTWNTGQVIVYHDK